MRVVKRKRIPTGRGVMTDVDKKNPDFLELHLYFGGLGRRVRIG